MKRLHRITDFSGGIRQDVAADQVPQNALVECKGFEISKKTGALVRQLGWKELQTMDIVGHVPLAGIAYVLEEPDGPQEVKLIATDGPKIYMKPYWSGSAWVESWFDIDGYAPPANSPTQQWLSWNSVAGNFKSWLVRDGVLRIAMGTSSETDYPLWFGYINNKYFPDLDTDDFHRGEFSNFVLQPTILLPPKWPYVYLYVHPETPPADMYTKYGTYEFALSYVYDGYQEGPLGRNVGLNGDTIAYGHGTQQALWIDVNLRAEFTDEVRYDKRWTAVRLYVKYTPQDSVTSVAPFDWTLLAHIPITEQFEGVSSNSGVGYTGGWLENAGGIGTADAYRARVYLNNTASVAGMTYWDSVGHTNDKQWHLYTYDRLGTSGDQLFIGNVKEVISDKTSNNVAIYDRSVRFAARQGWTGSVAPDVLPPLNFVGTETQAGEGPIQAIGENYGRIVVVREHSMIELTPSATTTYILKVKSAFAGVGCIAPKTFVKIGDGLYFAAENFIWKYDGLECVPISKSIKTWWQEQDLDDKKSAFAGYFPQRNQYWVAIPKDTTTDIMIYDLDTGAWVQTVLYSTTALLKGFFAGSDEAIYAFDNTKLYTPSDTDYAQKVHLKTGHITMGLPDVVKRFKELHVIHEGTGLTNMNIYVDGTAVAGSGIPPYYYSFPAVGSTKTITKYHLDSAKGKYLEFELEDGADSDITTVDIHEIGVYYDTRKI